MLSYQLLRKRSYNPLFHDPLTTSNNEETKSVYRCIQMHTDVCRCIQMYTAV